jgi:O-acetylserine/cysteine efflux transporter
MVAAIWGFNFIAIKLGVAGMPPLFLVAVRFILTAFPAVFFIKRPKVPLGYLAVYGLLLGVGQFGLVFTAMKMGAPAGLTSIILQSQAFFTALLAAVFLKERIRLNNVIGMALAAAGLAAIAFSGNTASLTPTLTVMILAAAGFWATANIVAKAMPKTDGLSLIVWSSLFSPIPLFGLSFLLEGKTAIVASLGNLGLVSVGALAYLVLLSTLFGYGVWNQLIMRFGASRIAPFSLLIPIFGVSAGALVLGERFSLADGVAAVLVLIGLLVHVFGAPKRLAPVPAAQPNRP